MSKPVHKESKSDLLKELESIRDALAFETRSSGSNTSDDKTNGAATKPPKIPLLQEIFDPQRPNQSIHLQQLDVDSAEIFADFTVFDTSDFHHPSSSPETGEKTELQNPVASANPLDDPNQLNARGEVEPGSEENTPQETEVLALLELLPISTAQENQIIALAANEELQDANTETIIDQVIEQHVDQILALFRSTLRDNLPGLLKQWQQQHKRQEVEDQEPSAPEPEPEPDDHANRYL